MILFKYVKYKNFLSTGNQPITIQLDKSPTTLIAGANGAGKSTMLDAIFFGLFNKPFRNIKKPSLVNSINMGALEVEIVFTIGKKEFKVIRGIKPGKFELYENGKLIDQTAATRDYQRYLEDIILGGLNEKVFKQVVVIGSADYSPFMQLRAADRREVIEELLDITIFSEMLLIAKEKLSVLKSTLQDLDYSIDLSVEKLKMRHEVEEKQKEEVDGKRQELKDSITLEEDKIEVLNTKISALKDQNSQYEEQYKGHDLLTASIDDLKKLLTGLKTTKRTHDNKIAFFNENDDCPTCQQDIGTDHKDNLVKLSTDKLVNVDTAIERVIEDLEKKSVFLKKYKALNTAIRATDKEIYEAEADNKSTYRFIKKMQSDIAKLSAPKENNADQITELEEEHKDLTLARQEELETQSYYAAVAGMLKDGGIKTKIIRQYIPLMNKIINDYLVRFGLPIEFTLDENFNEVIKSRHRDSFQYNNFSEGEKQRINLSLLLAWREIARAKNTTNTNLLIFDETFDSSLDAHATEELLNILLEMDVNTNIFIISHKQDLSDKLRSHIEFEKKGNFTHIKARPN